MADYRSKSFGDGKMQIQRYYGPAYSTGGRPDDFRSYNFWYAPTAAPPPGFQPQQAETGNSTSSGSWGFGDPEFQRKRRLAGYKAYSVEGKVKGSLRKSFRWLKDKYTQVLYGWW